MMRPTMDSLAEAYERREQLELLVYQADAARARIVREIARALEAGSAEAASLTRLREDLVAATRMLIELTARLQRGHRRLVELDEELHP